MQTNQPGNLIYYRLIALWVLNEALLGGIIHGLKMPVSGLIVGSCAVACICLIAWYVPKKGAILKATLIVAIFKMMLSPQAPLPAYFAVFFQGLMGELLFWRRKGYAISCILLGVLALLESGLQRILVLTIMYGKGLWTAINIFFNNLTGQESKTNYSYFLISWYVLAHVIVGLFLGLWAGMLPRNIKEMKTLQKEYPIVANDSIEEIEIKRKRRRKRRIYFFIVWVLLILLYVQSYFKIGTPLLPSNIALQIFLRSVIIVFTWLFIIGPLITRALNVWLLKKRQHLSHDIRQVTQLLPATQRLIAQSWRLSAEKRGGRRIIFCVRIILANTFYPGGD